MVKFRGDIRALLRAELRDVRGPPSTDNAAKAFLDLRCGEPDTFSNI